MLRTVCVCVRGREQCCWVCSFMVVYLNVLLWVRQTVISWKQSWAADDSLLQTLLFGSWFSKWSLKKQCETSVCLDNVRFPVIHWNFFSWFIYLCSRYQRALSIYGCSQAKGHCVVLLMHTVLLEVTLSVSALSGGSLRVTDWLIQEIDFIRAENDILSACLKAKRDIWTHI